MLLIIISMLLNSIISQVDKPVLQIFNIILLT